MSKFEVGEIAILVKAFGPNEWDYGAEPYFDTECTILELCASNSDVGPRHRIELHDGRTCQVTEHFLRKRPDDQPFSEWFRNTIITDPIAVPGLETTMRNVARNLQKFTTDTGARDG